MTATKTAAQELASRLELGTQYAVATIYEVARELIQDPAQADLLVRRVECEVTQLLPKKEDRTFGVPVFLDTEKLIATLNNM